MNYIDSNTLLLINNGIDDFYTSEGITVTNNNGITTTAGNFDTGLSLNGTSYATFENLNISSNSITIDFWVKLNNTLTGFPTVFSFNDANSARSGTFCHISSDKIYFGPNEENEFYVNVTTNINTWYHMAFIINNNIGCIYRNGVLLGQKQFNSSIISNKLTLGCLLDSGNYGHHFKGDIDCFRVSKGARWTSSFEVPTKELVPPPKLENIDINSSLVECVSSLPKINTQIEILKNKLYSALSSKGIEVSSDDKISNLIDKVNDEVYNFNNAIASDNSKETFKLFGLRSGAFKIYPGVKGSVKLNSNFCLYGSSDSLSVSFYALIGGVKVQETASTRITTTSESSPQTFSITFTNLNPTDAIVIYSTNRCMTPKNITVCYDIV